jgi:hypothetical protein
MYWDTGAGKEPLPPALLAMALVLQGCVGMSDLDAVEASAFDARWQMALGRLGETEPAFSQGALRRFASGSSRATWTSDSWSPPPSWRGPPASSTGRAAKVAAGGDRLKPARGGASRVTIALGRHRSIATSARAEARSKAQRIMAG